MNPIVLLGLVEAFADPELVALVRTVSDARAQCALDFWTSELFSATVGLLSCPPSSPTMVLLERLQLIGLSVLPDGSFGKLVLESSAYVSSGLGMDMLRPKCHTMWTLLDFLVSTQSQPELL